MVPALPLRLPSNRVPALHRRRLRYSAHHASPRPTFAITTRDPNQQPLPRPTLQYPARTHHAWNAAAIFTLAIHPLDSKWVLWVPDWCPIADRVLHDLGPVLQGLAFSGSGIVWVGTSLESGGEGGIGVPGLLFDLWNWRTGEIQSICGGFEASWLMPVAVCIVTCRYMTLTQ